MERLLRPQLRGRLPWWHHQYFARQSQSICNVLAEKLLPV